MGTVWLNGLLLGIHEAIAERNSGDKKCIIVMHLRYSSSDRYIFTLRIRQSYCYRSSFTDFPCDAQLTSLTTLYYSDHKYILLT